MRTERPALASLNASTSCRATAFCSRSRHLQCSNCRAKAQGAHLVCVCRVAPSSFIGWNSTQQWHGSCGLGQADALPRRHLQPDCPLFARKFSSRTAVKAHAFLTSCGNELGILACCDDSARWDARRHLGRLGGIPAVPFLQ